MLRLRERVSVSEHYLLTGEASEGCYLSSRRSCYLGEHSKCWCYYLNC